MNLIAYKYEGDPTFFWVGLFFVAAIMVCISVISKDETSIGFVETYRNRKGDKPDKLKKGLRKWLMS